MRRTIAVLSALLVAVGAIAGYLMRSQKGPTVVWIDQDTFEQHG